MKRLIPILIIPLALLTASIAINGIPSCSSRTMGAVESLSAPIPISGWNADALLTPAGTAIPIPNISNLPAASPFPTHALSRGIERAPSGQITVLVRIRHSCGNDPVSADILRLNLSDLLTFLHIGASTLPLPPDIPTAEPLTHFDPSTGWDISDYLDFMIWQTAAHSPYP